MIVFLKLQYINCGEGRVFLLLTPFLKGKISQVFQKKALK